MQTNTKALAKIVVNKKLNTLRLLVTFDTVANKVTVLNAAFKSGDICNIADSAEYKQYCIAKTLANAEAQLRTNNIVFAD